MDGDPHHQGGAPQGHRVLQRHVLQQVRHGLPLRLAGVPLSLQGVCPLRQGDGRPVWANVWVGTPTE